MDRRSRYQPRMEHLESRLTPACMVYPDPFGVLHISGANTADHAIVRNFDGDVTVEHWSDGDAEHLVNHAYGYNITSIVFDGYDGDDSFVNYTALPAVAHGGSGKDLLIGGEADDILAGDAGKDQLYGGLGNDRLYGGADADRLYGEDGDDWLDAGSSGEWARGGEGTNFSPYVLSIHRARYTDIFQGNANTCWIVSSISSVAYTGVNLPSRIHYLGDNNFEVSLFNYADPANRETSALNPVTEIVTFDGTVFGADAMPNPNETAKGFKELWVILTQRALIQAISDWDETQNIENPHSGAAGDPLGMLTGRNSTWMGNDLGAMQDALRAGRNVVSDTLDPPGTPLDNSLLNFHQYLVLRTYYVRAAETFYVVLRNPWGRDGGSETSGDPDDGIVTLTWAEFNTSMDGMILN